ncbi:MAG: hypothetical protein HOV80_02295 [Polyangiaceae bacterium]|nr:hypothetical protein [Polyangiaceae bacterium]
MKADPLRSTGPLGGALVLVLVGCTQILGVEEGQLDGGGAGGSGVGGATSVTSMSTGTMMTATTATGTTTTTTTTACDPPDCFDGDDCTDDVCQGGTCQHPILPMGTPCGNGLVCDAAGSCSGCTMASQCGTDTVCATYVCNGGSCSINYQPMGTQVGDPIPFDCKADACTGSSPDPVAVPFHDPPFDDNECALPGCTSAGDIFNFPDAISANCVDGAVSGICEANGECRACSLPAECDVSGYGPNCQSGSCHCNDDVDCIGNNRRGPHCMGALGNCACQDDAECIGNVRGEDCISTSACGCDAAIDCVNVPGKPVCGSTGVCVPVQI